MPGAAALTESMGRSAIGGSSSVVSRGVGASAWRKAVGYSTPRLSCMAWLAGAPLLQQSVHVESSTDHGIWARGGRLDFRIASRRHSVQSMLMGGRSFRLVATVLLALEADANRPAPPLCDETVCEVGVDEGCGCLVLVPSDECPGTNSGNVWWNCEVRAYAHARATRQPAPQPCRDAL